MAGSHDQPDHGCSSVRVLSGWTFTQVSGLSRAAGFTRAALRGLYDWPAGGGWEWSPLDAVVPQDSATPLQVSPLVADGPWLSSRVVNVYSNRLTVDRWTLLGWDEEPLDLTGYAPVEWRPISWTMINDPRAEWRVILVRETTVVQLWGTRLSLAWVATLHGWAEPA